LNKYLLYLFFISSPLTVSAAAMQQDSIGIETFIPAADTVAAPAAYNERSFGNFKEKYKSSEFSYETKAKAKSSWDRFLEAVRRFFSRLFSFGGKTTNTTAFDIFMKVLAFCIIGLVVYMIVRIILKKEGMWIFGRSRKKITVNDITEEDIHHMDFRQLINDTKTTGDYRLAVRYYYLWLLKKLSNNEIIDWHWDKTNSDYLYEIKNTGLRKDFEYLSYVYDYSWYGDFPLDENAFAKAESAFMKTLNSL
jgi:hypothetical protein